MDGSQSKEENGLRVPNCEEGCYWPGLLLATAPNRALHSGRRVETLLWATGRGQPLAPVPFREAEPQEMNQGALQLLKSTPGLF